MIQSKKLLLTSKHMFLKKIVFSILIFIHLYIFVLVKKIKYKKIMRNKIKLASWRKNKN